MLFESVIGKILFKKDMKEWMVMIKKLGIFEEGYMVSKVGGIVMENLGEKLGRKRVLEF